MPDLLVLYLLQKWGDTMRDKEYVKAELQERLGEVKQRLQILDLIQERLIKMQSLAQRGLKADLSSQEILEINQQLRVLQEEIRLLESERTQLS